MPELGNRPPEGTHPARTGGAWLRTLLVLCAGAGLATLLTTGTEPDHLDVVTTPPIPAFDSARLILNALLVPAFDADALPLRWVDPRPAMNCGPRTTVRMNHAPLQAGATVPDKPFELEWYTDGCFPFGTTGPRFDGRVRLTVFREDWGFSAIVEPSGLRVTSLGNKPRLIPRGVASLPQSVDADPRTDLIDFGTDR